MNCKCILFIVRLYTRSYYQQNKRLSKGVGAIYRDKTYLQEEGLSKADIISWGRAFVLQVEERGYKDLSTYREKDYLQGEGPTAEKATIYRKE